jgi:hypothetical protein
MPKVYRSFEEFEREELRRTDSLHQTFEDMLDEMFADELDFDFAAGERRGRRARDDEDDE